MRHHIEQGGVLVNEVSRVVQHADVLVLEVDLAAKHAHLLSYGTEDGGFVIYLSVDEHTINFDVSLREAHTTIHLRDVFPPGKRTDIHASVSGYTLLVLLFSRG